MGLSSCFACGFFSGRVIPVVARPMGTSYFTARDLSRVAGKKSPFGIHSVVVGSSCLALPRLPRYPPNSALPAFLNRCNLYRLPSSQERVHVRRLPATRRPGPLRRRADPRPQGPHRVRTPLRLGPRRSLQPRTPLVRPPLPH